MARENKLITDFRRKKTLPWNPIAKCSCELTSRTIFVFIMQAIIYGWLMSYFIFIDNGTRNLKYSPSLLSRDRNRTSVNGESLASLRKESVYYSYQLHKASLFKVYKLSCFYLPERLTLSNTNIPVAHNAMKVWACFFTKCTLCWGSDSRWRMWSRKSFAITTTRSHFSFSKTKYSQS